ncbi:aminopeptidase [Longispora fulva]|uniref:Aminopeptidase N n=1 Tax=Longispora fulva TaxID=619741 RepID=A0A8J7KZD4_9ACTN|nr:aminopeptidase N [Longispora fulva]MBG6140792.1 aminopeptidase N [Longispora fulva]GIG60944.1 aminopeptidase [Longispora fulva]
MPSLTRTEAAERAALLTVRATDVALDLTTGDTEFHSVTTIRFSSTGPSTFVDIKPATLHSATLNGVALDVAAFEDERLPLTGLAAENELVVVADMLYSHEGEGLHRFVDPADGRVYLYAHSFMDAAPRWFACFDQPDLKSPYTFTVKAPEGWTVLGNEAATLVDGLWRLEETKPLSTYFVTLIAGPYHAVRSEHDGIPLGLYCRQSLAEFLDADAEELFTVTGECFDEFHRLFEVRYPFGKYDQVFCPEFNAGAMENPGCVTFRDQVIFRGAVTDSERGMRAMTVAHEMAHMWFGDLVTMRWWDDLWLNESFADYLGHRVTADATRFTESWTAFAVRDKTFGYAADQRPSTHPISGKVPDAASGLLNFDAISYAKGASVLRQLVARIGDDALLAGLREHFARHAYGNAELKDFLAALSESSGRDLSDWAKVWLTEANVNTLHPEITVTDGVITAAAIRQTAADTHPVLRPHTLGVGLYDEDTFDVVRVEVDGALTELPQLVGRPAPKVVLLNDGDLTYAKVRFDDRSLAALPEVLPKLSSLNRAMVWGALFQAVRDGGLSAVGYADVVAGAVAAESEVTTLTVLIRVARTHVVDVFCTPDERPGVLAQLAGAYRSMLADAEPASGRALAVFRGLIDVSVDVPQLRGWLDGDGVPAGLTVDVERAWQIRLRLAVLGSLTGAELDVAAAADPSAHGQASADMCRSARPTPEAKAGAWEALMTDGGLSNYTVWSLAEGFWQPEQQELTAPYVERFFTELPVAGKLRSFQVLERLANLLYPRYAVAAETLRLTADLLAGDDLAPPVRRAVVDRSDDLRRALEARG